MYLQTFSFWSVVCLFIFFSVSFKEQGIKFNYPVFRGSAFYICSIKYLPNLRSQKFSPMFSFILIFEFYFIYFLIQQVLISHQFYTHQCVHVNPNRPIQHTTIPTPPQLSPLGVHMFVLYICVSVSALKTGSSVPFF